MDTDDDAVQAYETARDALKYFWERNAPLREELLQLQDNFRAAVQQLEKRVRVGLSTHNDFKKWRETTTYDADKLREIYGEDAVAKGYLEVATSVVVNKEKLAAAIASGEITKELAQKFTTVITSYSVPKETKL